MRRMFNRRWRRRGYAVFAAAVALAVLEVAAGLGLPPTGKSFIAPYEFDKSRFDHPLFAPDPLLFWRLRPGATMSDEDLRVNRDGLRGPELGEKRADTLRLACLGDSTTFGFKVAEADSYPARLAQLLAEDYRVEVLNAGVPGYSTLQGLRFLEREVLTLRPDVLVVGLGANDLLEAAKPDSRQRLYHPLTFALRNWLLRRNLTRLLAGWFGDAPPENDGQTTRVPELETTDNLRSIAAQAKAHGAEAFFFLPVYAGSPDLTLHGILLPEAVATIDVAGAFIAAAGADPLFAGDLLHPTPAGYRVLAEAVADGLRRAGVLERYRR